MSEYKLNLLVAYPYLKTKIISFLKKNKSKVRFVLDSGAFTAWKSGNPIEVEDYCDFIDSLPIKPWRYFTLDKIGDPEGSYENYQYMLGRGLNPIPIFTRGENLDMIDKYYETSDVLGLGGLVGTKGNRGFVKGIMERVGDRKVHWLGFTNKDFISYFSPYMCDCSSWSYVTRYGNMFIYDFKGGFHSIYRKEFATKPPNKILKAIEKMGYDPTDFGVEESWRGDYCLSKELNAQSYLLKSIDSHKLFKTHMFLACGSVSDMEILLKHYDKLVK